MSQESHIILKMRNLLSSLACVKTPTKNLLYKLYFTLVTQNPFYEYLYADKCRQEDSMYGVLMADSQTRNLNTITWLKI